MQEARQARQVNHRYGEERSTPSSVVSQRVADVLAERIFSGELAPGTRIRQNEIASELQTSRIPVREGLRILETRGLVTVRANTGAWVTAMNTHDLGITYEIRERIEPLLLTDSLPRLTDDDIDAMRSLQEQMESNEDPQRFLTLDREFHWLSYSRHGTPQLAAMIQRLWDTTHPYRRAYAELAAGEGSWIIHAEHRLLMHAVSRRETTTAATVMALHIRRTRLDLVEHPDLFEDRSGEPAGSPVR